MPGKLILSITDGPIRGQVYTFEEHETFIFGRANDCHGRLSPDDATASRHHFILEVNPPDARMRDLGSRNGTYVNGVKYGGRGKDETPEEAAKRKFPEVDIKDGDRIEVGKTVFDVHIELALPSKTALAIGETDLLNPMICNLCGKDVLDEVGLARRGDYICRSCQATAKANPAAILAKEPLIHAGGDGKSTPSDIAGYKFCAKLGEGGMGAVYLARRAKDGATVALKVLLAKVAVDERSRRMFQREIEETRRLRHPHIVESFEAGSAGSVFYFVMEFCPGGSVDKLMERRGGRLSLTEAGPIILQALEGLSFAHARGLVHRDLKPQNILLTAPSSGMAKLSDFGLAKGFEKAGLSGMTATGSVSGTLAFMPREQLINFKYAKPVSDVWSMGATLYYLLTTHTPRDFLRGRDPLGVILHQDAVPVQNRDSSISKRVAEVIDRAVKDNVKERFQTAAEFREALARVL